MNGKAKCRLFKNLTSPMVVRLLRYGHGLAIALETLALRYTVRTCDLGRLCFKRGLDQDAWIIYSEDMTRKLEDAWSNKVDQASDRNAVYATGFCVRLGGCRFRKRGAPCVSVAGKS